MDGQLDKLDCKIVYELGEDSRQSYKQIAKKISSKKEVVAYHLQKMLNEGIISKFVPVFSLSEIGIFSSKIYIKLHGLTRTEEERLYSSLVKDKAVAWVAKSIGAWDLLIGVYSRNIIEFGKIKEEIFNRFGKYVRDYEVTHIEDAQVFNRDYLIDKKTAYRNNFIFSGSVGDKKLSGNEIKVIKLIKNNSRFGSLEVANRIGVDARTVVKVLRDLKEKKILQGNTVFLDLKKLGLQLHKLCFYFENYDKKAITQFIDFLKQNKKIIHLIKSQGPWEFEVEMEESSIERIYDYVREIRNSFPNLIKKIDIVSITDELKLEFFPEN